MRREGFGSRVILAFCALIALEERALATPDLPAVFVDAIQIEQVLLNLIRNGIEATSHLADKKRQLKKVEQTLKDLGARITGH